MFSKTNHSQKYGKHPQADHAAADLELMLPHMTC